jgi:hypothetical protein
MDRAAVPSDTRLLDVLLVRLSTRHGQRHPGGAIRIETANSVLRTMAMWPDHNAAHAG